MPEKESSRQFSAQEIDTLRESEEKLLTLLPVLRVGVSVLGKDKKPIYSNSALRKILGLSDDELHQGLYKKRKYLRADGSLMPVNEFPSTYAFRERKAI